MRAHVDNDEKNSAVLVDTTSIERCTDEVIDCGYGLEFVTMVEISSQKLLSTVSKLRLHMSVIRYISAVRHSYIRGHI